MNPLLFSAILFLCAGLLLLLAGKREFSKHRLLVQRMGPNGRLNNTSGIKRLGNRTLGRWRWNVDGEVLLLLDQLGWRRPGQRALYFASQVGLPLLVLVIMGGRYLLDASALGSWIGVLFAVGVAFLLPKRLLVAAVNRRRQRLGREVATMIPLLRMFLEVGMTVEQALRILLAEGKQILPEFTLELRSVIIRIDAGLDLGEELRATATLMDVDELTDCVSILDQLIRQGGGAMASLRALKVLLDDRHMTTLQETVSKLSAKMSAVMVAFLFPALLIILAGPGFIAIFRALGDIGG